MFLLTKIFVFVNRKTLVHILKGSSWHQCPLLLQYKSRMISHSATDLPRLFGNCLDFLAGLGEQMS